MSDGTLLRPVAVPCLGSFLGATTFVGCQSTEAIDLGAGIGAFVAIPIGLGLLASNYRKPLSAFFWIFPIIAVAALLTLAFTYESTDKAAVEAWAVLLAQTVFISWSIGGVLALTVRRSAGEESADRSKSPP